MTTEIAPLILMLHGPSLLGFWAILVQQCTHRNEPGDGQLLN